MSKKIYAASCAILLVACTMPAGLTALDDKEKPEKKESQAAQQDPILREHFRERALGLQPDLIENKKLLDERIDKAIDDFVKEISQLAEKMARNADELKELKKLAGPALYDKATREKLKNKVDLIKSTAKSLQSKLDFLILLLRLDTKNLGVDTQAVAREQIPAEIESLVSLIDEFEKKLDEFLFPKSRTVSIEDLQRSALPVLLKKIERHAEKIENTIKKP
jgi:hypothetical protein